MDIAHNIFYLTVPFLTVWVLILHILYYLGPLRKFQDSLLILAVIVSIGGFILTYIHPKYYKMKLRWNDYDREIVAKGKMAKILDLVFHQLPLLLLVILYNTKMKGDNLILAFMILVVYLLISDPVKYYNIDCSNNKGKWLCSFLLFINLILIGLFFIILLNKLIR